jgi:hypothetical protein
MRRHFNVIGLAVSLLVPVGVVSQVVESATSPSRVISAAVEASWFATGRSGVEHLELVVLWRGTPGWFMEPGGSSGGSSGGNGVPRSSWITRGEVRLTVEFDPAKRIATIQGQRLALADHNVVFVDDVDAPGGPRIVKTLQVARIMPGSAGQIGLVLKDSPEVIKFLRCDATRPDGRAAGYLRQLCLQNIGIVR